MADSSLSLAGYWPDTVHTCLKWPKLETQVGGPEPEPEQIFSKTANF